MAERKGTLIPRKIGEILIEFFAEKTQLPIILFEEGMDGPRFLETSKRNFSAFCKLLHSFGYYDKCSQDHLTRASQCLEKDVSMCWMGLTNAAVPISVNKERKAVLLYGQKRLNEPESLEKSEHIFNKEVSQLNIDPTQIQKLKEEFAKIQMVKREMLDPEYLSDFKRLNDWLFSLISEKIKFERNVLQVNHELTNNLQAAIADAEVHWMKLPASVKEHKESAIGVLHALQRMNVVVQNFAKLYGQYKFKPLFLRAMLDRSVDIYRSLAKKKGIDIVIHESPYDEMPRIKGSKRHLELALNNLIHNAVKYSHRGFHRSSINPMTVDIEGYRYGSSYRLTIQNFGVGILSGEISSGKIFEPGYKGSLTQKEYKTGGGYGLATARDNIKKHNGNLTINSEPKGGTGYLTTVTITFNRLER